jgi:hypothetical protein
MLKEWSSMPSRGYTAWPPLKTCFKHFIIEALIRQWMLIVLLDKSCVEKKAEKSKKCLPN